MRTVAYALVASAAGQEAVPPNTEGLNILFNVGAETQTLKLQCLHKCPDFPLDEAVEMQCGFVQSLKSGGKDKLDACTSACSPWQIQTELETMMEQCEASLGSWTGECLADCPNIPVQAEAAAAKTGSLRVRNLADLMKMRQPRQFSRKLDASAALQKVAQEEEDLRWCNFFMALTCTEEACDPCLSDCTNDDLDQLNAMREQCSNADGEEIAADDDGKENENYAAISGPRGKIITFQGGVESAITVTGYTISDLNTVSLRKSFVYAMAQTLKVPERDILILTQLEDGVDIKAAGDPKLVSYWDAGGCGPYGNDYNRNWCMAAPQLVPGGPGGLAFGQTIDCKPLVSVPSGTCPSGHAKLGHMYGNGQCCLSVAGCDMFYYAQYECTSMDLVAYWDPSGCGMSGPRHNWDWCSQTSFECKPEVTVAKTVCPLGVAKLLGTRGGSNPQNLIALDECEEDGCVWVPQNANKTSSAAGAATCGYAYFASYGCVDNPMPPLPVKGGGQALPGQVEGVNLIPWQNPTSGEPIPGTRIEFGVRLRTQQPPDFPDYQPDLVQVKLQSMYEDCLFTMSGQLNCKNKNKVDAGAGEGEKKETKETLAPAGETPDAATSAGAGREPLPAGGADSGEEGWNLLDIFRTQFSKQIHEHQNKATVVQDLSAGGVEEPRPVPVNPVGQIAWTPAFGKLGEGVKSFSTDPNDSKGGGASHGAKIFGVIVLVAGLAGLVYFVQKKYRQQPRSGGAAGFSANAPAESSGFTPGAIGGGAAQNEAYPRTGSRQSLMTQSL